MNRVAIVMIALVGALGAALFARSSGTEGPALFTVALLRTLQDRGMLVRDADDRWVVGEDLDWQALPARICWLGYGQRHRAGLAFNELVRNGKVKAPIVIGRDHLDIGAPFGQLAAGLQQFGFLEAMGGQDGDALAAQTRSSSTSQLLPYTARGKILGTSPNRNCRSFNARWLASWAPHTVRR